MQCRCAIVTNSACVAVNRVHESAAIPSRRASKAEAKCKAAVKSGLRSKVIVLSAHGEPRCGLCIERKLRVARGYRCAMQLQSQ